MAILLDRNTVALFFCEPKGARFNFMAEVKRVADGAQLTYRFRHFKDDELFPKSKDVMNWYEARGKSVPEMLATVEQLVAHTFDVFGYKVIRVDAGENGADDEFVARCVEAGLPLHVTGVETVQPGARGVN